MSIETSAPTPQGVSRRTMIKAAAWSAPVVAVAVATPLASASPGQATAISGATSLVSTNPSTVAPGQYSNVQVTSRFTNGYLTISNVVGSWETGTLTLTVTNGSPTTGRAFLDPSNNPITTTGGIYIAGGLTWTVTQRTSYILTLTAPSQTLAAPGPYTFQAPVITTRATYAGTWDEDEGEWPVVVTGYTVSALNVGSGGGAQGTFPTDPFAPPA